MSDPTTTKKPEPEVVLQFKRTSDLGVGECEFVLMHEKDTKEGDVVTKGRPYLAPRKDPETLEETNRLFGRVFSYKATYKAGYKFCKELSFECTDEDGNIDEQKFISAFEKIDSMGETRSVLIAELKETSARFFFLITEENRSPLDIKGPDGTVIVPADPETKTCADRVKAINAALAKKDSKPRRGVTPALSVA